MATQFGRVLAPCWSTARDAQREVRLEEELEAEANVAVAATLDERIGETDTFTDEAGIVDEGINASADDRAEVRMVKGIGKVRMELQAVVFREVEGFEDSEVEDVGVEVAEDVSAGVAEGSAEDLIGHGGVGDEADGLLLG